MGGRAKQRRLEEKLEERNIGFEEKRTRDGPNLSYSLTFTSTPEFLDDLNLCAGHAAALPRKEHRSYSIDSVDLSQHSDSDAHNRELANSLGSNIFTLAKDNIAEIRRTENVPKDARHTLGGLASIAAIVATYAYTPVCSWAVGLAEAINDQSPFLSPMAGAAQLAVSILPSVSAGFLAYHIFGMIAEGVASVSSRDKLTMLNLQLDIYHSAERFLYNYWQSPKAPNSLRGYREGFSSPPIVELPLGDIDD